MMEIINTTKEMDMALFIMKMEQSHIKDKLKMVCHMAKERLIAMALQQKLLGLKASMSVSLIELISIKNISFNFQYYLNKHIL